MKTPFVRLSFTLISLFIGSLHLQSQFIFNRIEADPDLQEFEEAIIRAGLRNTFNSFGNIYTIFAPSNDVFPLLPGSLTQEQVRDIVLTHCVNGFYKSNNLVNGFSITTMNQRNLTVKKNSDGIFINGAKIIERDLFATNGILHKIDSYIPLDQTTRTTVLSRIENSPNHTILENIIKNAGLEDRYTGNNMITCFAPTDEAFNALSQAKLDTLLGTNVNYIENYLMYHVIDSLIQTNQFKNGGELTAANGQTISVTVDINGTFVNNIKVIFTGLPADNGILYVIQQVLVPAPIPALTIADYIEQSEDHTILKNLVLSSGLRPTLDADTPVKTFFAPTDTAFNLLSDALLDELTADPTGLLADVLSNHLLIGKFYRNDLIEEEVKQAVNDFILKFIEDEFMYFVNDARFVIHDIEVDNGLVHVIDAVLTEELKFTVKNILENNEILTGYNSYIVEGNLDDLLDGTGPFTVFAPSNQAMVTLPSNVREQIDNGMTDQLIEFLSNHIIENELLADDLNNGIVFNARNGFLINVSTDSSNDIFLNNSMITVQNLIADNGVVHIIDLALFPDQEPSTIYEYVEANNNHSILKNAIDLAGLEFIYNGVGPLTLFAPTNAAFDNIPDEVLGAILNGPQSGITDLLLRHTLDDDYSAADLLALMTRNNVNAEELVFTTINNDVYVNNSRIEVIDLQFDNGIVHVMDAVIVLPEEQNTIMDVVENSADHTILEEAINAAGLFDKYELETSLTLFAPTDAAFNALPTSMLNDLLADPNGSLRDLILYHSLDDRLESTDLTEGLVLTTSSGEELEVFIDGLDIFINEALISVRDVVADNGIVHVMDAVIQPIVIRNTVYDVISNSSNFSLLKEAIDAAGIDQLLINDPTITVFAPSNQAFQNISQDSIDSWMSDPDGLLREILLYHTFDRLLPTSNMSDGLNIVMANGETAVISDRFDGLYINDSRLSTPDIPADNGYVHGINSFSMPIIEPVTVYDIISSQEELSIFKAAVDAAGFDAVYNDAELITVFAPNDDAFNSLDQGILNELLADPNGLLASLINYHSHDGLLLTSLMANGLNIPMNNGESVLVSFDGNDIFINNAKIVISDLEADNGVVQLIDAVIMREEVERYTVYDIISTNPNYTILKTAVDDAGLDVILQDAEMLTVFAPTDQAFYSLGSALLNQLMADPNGMLAELLSNHTYGELLPFASMMDGLDIEMEGGYTAGISLRSDGFYIDDARIILYNVMADNGIVHMINAIVNPPIISSTNVLDKPAYSIYPNPANDRLYIKDHSYGTDKPSIKIYDSAGRLLKKWNDQSLDKFLDVSRLSQGQYFLLIDNKASILVESFIKLE